MNFVYGIFNSYRREKEKIKGHQRHTEKNNINLSHQRWYSYKLKTNSFHPYYGSSRSRDRSNSRIQRSAEILFRIPIKRWIVQGRTRSCRRFRSVRVEDFSLSLSLSPRPLRIVIPVLIYGGHKLDSRFIYERTFARLAPPMIKCRRWKRRLELFLFPRRL